jgi:hypothetical protein
MSIIPGLDGDRPTLPPCFALVPKLGSVEQNTNEPIAEDACTIEHDPGAVFQSQRHRKRPGWSLPEYHDVASRARPFGTVLRSLRSPNPEQGFGPAGEVHIAQPTSTIGPERQNPSA